MVADFTNSHLSSIQRDCTDLSGDSELVVGEIYGLRQWTIKTDSNTPALVGHHGGAWHTVGSNLALCDRNIKEVDVRLQLGVTEDELIDVATHLFSDNVSLDLLLVVDCGQKVCMSIRRPASRYAPLIVTGTLPVTAQPRLRRAAAVSFEELYRQTLQDRASSLRLVGRVMLDDHRPAEPSCTCGYYAYTDESSLNRNSSWRDGSVFGIIKGYGQVTQGSKGFRCEKAEIVALTRPQVSDHGSYRAPVFVSSVWQELDRLFTEVVPPEVRVVPDLAALLHAARGLVTPADRRQDPPLPYNNGGFLPYTLPPVRPW
jgi:hypothetical protein